MAKQRTWHCETCDAELTKGNFRTITYPDCRVFLCKLCFLKLEEQHRSHRSRKPQLSEQVSYTQAELPF